MVLWRAKHFWIRFWMARAGSGLGGRIATRLATRFAPPYYARCELAEYNLRGYVAPSATVHHPHLRLGKNIFIGERVTIFQHHGGGPVEIGNHARLCDESFFQTGQGGCLTIGANTWIHPRCQLSAYKASIHIGYDVQIGPYCAFYSYDHGFAPGAPISSQPLQTKGDIHIGDGAWLGYGVIVLSGVRIGKGAVIGAGSVVTRDIADNAIAMGTPARTVKMRGDL